MRVPGQKPADAAPIPGEQAADLAALTAAAEAAPPLPGSPEAAAMAMPDQRERIAGELSALVLAFVGIARPILPSLAEIYTTETTQAAAAAVAAVCVKHGWLDDGLMGEWGEEIAAAVVLLPLGFATVQGVRADLAARKPAGAALADGSAAPLQVAESSGPVAAGSRAVQFGNVPIGDV